MKMRSVRFHVARQMVHLCMIGVLTLPALASCGHKSAEPVGPSTDSLAAEAGRAAKGYYDQLLAGQLDNYVAGLDGTQKATAIYRQLQRDNARLFLHRQDTLHQGIKAVEVDSTHFSAKDSTARVFLRMSYGDGTKERVLLPMLCRKGVWYMR